MIFKKIVTYARFNTEVRFIIKKIKKYKFKIFFKIKKFITAYYFKIKPVVY